MKARPGFGPNSRPMLDALLKRDFSLKSALCRGDLSSSCLRAVICLAEHLQQLYLSSWLRAQQWNLCALRCGIAWNVLGVDRLFQQTESITAFLTWGWHRMLLIRCVKWQRYQTANLQPSSVAASGMCNHKSAREVLFRGSTGSAIQRSGCWFPSQPGRRCGREILSIVQGNTVTMLFVWMFMNVNGSHRILE